jgi:hypothetical protein
LYVDFTLNSSVVLAAVVGLWLVWVGPYLLRRPGAPVLQPGSSAAVALSSTPTRNHGSQGSIMEMSAHARPAAAPPPPPGGALSSRGTGTKAAVRDSGPRPFRVRYGRLAVALAGAAALPAAAVFAVLAVSGMISAAAAPAALGVFAAAVMLLRLSAVREQRARADRAFERALAPAPHADRGPAAAHTRTDGARNRIFNADDGASAAADTVAADSAAAASDSPGSAGGQQQLSVAELRAAALEVAAQAGDTAAPVMAGAAWQPVEVPKPMYVEAAKAPRQEPAPLELPEAPRPAGRTPIKHAAAASRVTGGAAVQQAGASGDTGTGRLNLDAVLQRRRA